MSQHASGTFEIKSWDEKPYEETVEGAKLTRASVTKSFSGDVEGEGKVEYLMVYREDGSASFVGVERVVGRLGGRSGSFVLEHRGSYAGDTAEITWEVVPGSGTGDLRGLRGQGGSSATHQKQNTMTLDYDFE